jgi:hypothetical protein
MIIPKFGNEEARQREIDRTLAKVIKNNERAEEWIKSGDFVSAECALALCHKHGRKLAILRTPPLFEL